MKTTVEVAQACDIMRPRVYVLAKRLKIEPQGQDGRGRTLWPSSLIPAIRAAQRGPDPREGSWADDLRVEEGVLLIARRTKRADGGGGDPSPRHGDAKAGLHEAAPGRCVRGGQAVTRARYIP